MALGGEPVGCPVGRGYRWIGVSGGSELPVDRGFRGCGAVRLWDSEVVRLCGCGAAGLRDSEAVRLRGCGTRGLRGCGAGSKRSANQDGSSHEELPNHLLSYPLRSRTGSLSLCSRVLLSSQEVDKVKTLDLARWAFDDQYVGCRGAMERQLDADGTLDKEKQKSRGFRRAWDEAETIWRTQKKHKVAAELPAEFTDRHGTALVTYSGFISEAFDDAVRSGGRSYDHYMENFHFKSLHYYLTTAIQLLSGDCRRVEHLVYRAVHGVVFKPRYGPSNGTQVVRFGQFLPATLDDAASYSNDTQFTINSCFGVNVVSFSQFPQEQWVVIPGYEVFRVDAPEGETAAFGLTSTGKRCSNFNCAYLRGNGSAQTLDHCLYNSGWIPTLRNVHLLVVLLCSSAVQLLSSV
ncbi:T-cell ecto-ADP-ribosyltransferase 1-like [Spea bombifrons]|uniref:T-cell ecto-ADP-ribosyltransferase 1-like n=1 Tax=Spea bombifrons TaxID=233779 RepID=UPI00234A244A|nr:T-cell ecto-ADP-ribosyltransferase 1-like [Spea bombifrons]